MSVKRLGVSGISTGQPRSSKIWDQETFPGHFESIASAIVDASGASSITFSNIPQQYQHLQIRLNSLEDQANNIHLQFNGDTSSNYAYHELYGDGNSSSASGSGNYSYIKIGYTQGTSNYYTGAAIVDILDYTNTGKYKTVRSLGGSDANGSGFIMLRSGLWFKSGTGVTSDSITSITIFLQGTANFKQHSHFALYGIRG